MLPIWLQAVFCPAPRILGRAMRPFSLSHSLILRGLGNAIVSRGIPSRDDVVVFLHVCSRNHYANHSLFSGENERELYDWGKKCGNFSVQMAIQEINIYLDNYLARADRWTSGKGTGKAYGAPWELHALHTLCATYHLPLEQAWDVSAAYALALVDVHHEAEGAADLVTERELAAIDRATA